MFLYLPSPYFIVLLRQFPYLFAKIRKTVGIYKYIEKKDSIIETMVRTTQLSIYNNMYTFGFFQRK